MLIKKLDYEKSRYPVAVKGVTVSGKKLILEVEDLQNGIFYISIAGVKENVLCIRIYRDSYSGTDYDFINHEFLNGNAEVKIVEKHDQLTLSTSEMSVIIGKEPFSFCVYDCHNRNVYEEQFSDVNSVLDGYERIMPMGYAQGSTEHDTFMNICSRLRPQEYIYGLGEHFTEFNKRGQSIRMWNSDTLGCRDEKAYKNIPFYLSSAGYGMFVNSYRDVLFHIGTESNASLSIHVPGKEVEYFIITGENQKHIVSTLTNLTGPAAMPPEWSFGLWYSTGFKDSDQQSVLEDAAKFRELDIPCDVFHLDCYWLREDMWCDFVWDEERYPTRRDMIQKLKEMNYKLCLWMNPYVTVKSNMFRDGDEKGYFIKDMDGNTYKADLWHGLLSYCAVLDVTNPEAVGWYQEKLRNILRDGVDVLKTDFGEDIPEDSLFYNGKRGYEMRNIYSNLYNSIVYDITCEVNGHGMVWGRSGSAGMQKYPVCWSGDPRSCYEGMAGTLKGGLSIGISGVPFWSHDIGGFYGNVSEEVFVRWVQFGVFSSHSRLHGTTTRQPWAFSEQTCRITRFYIKLRYYLMPYILDNAKKCTEEGVPFIRPLFLEHRDPAVVNMWDEYYFGNNMIVAPVFGGDGERRSVYLPEGEWTDLLTGKKYTGRQWYELECALQYIPVFYNAKSDMSELTSRIMG